MNKIQISSQNIKKPVWINPLKKYCKKILNYRNIDNWEVSLLLCNDTIIQKLNRDFRKIDEPTDILTFVQETDYKKEGIYYAGDIIISLETLAANSEKYHVKQEEELRRLIIHGLLHLEGMTHDSNSSETEMLRLQEEILKVVGGRLF